MTRAHPRPPLAVAAAALLAAAVPCAAPAQGPALAPADSILLETGAAMVRAADAVAEIWPGFAPGR